MTIHKFKNYYCFTCKDFKEVFENQNDLVCLKCKTIIASFKIIEVEMFHIGEEVPGNRGVTFTLPTRTSPPPAPEGS